MIRNDRNRSQWIYNDEGLYKWWRSSGKSRSSFIKENRKEIDNVLSGRERPHYLAYGR